MLHYGPIDSKTGLIHQIKGRKVTFLNCTFIVFYYESVFLNRAYTQVKALVSSIFKSYILIFPLILEEKITWDHIQQGSFLQK